MNTAEQRAHEFALEIMKLYAKAKPQDSDKVDTQELFLVYETAYTYALEHA